MIAFCRFECLAIRRGSSMCNLSAWELAIDHQCTGVDSYPAKHSILLGTSKSISQAILQCAFYGYLRGAELK